MSISFSCNFCSRKYRVDDALAGRKVKCKECGTDLAIPTNNAVILGDADFAPSAATSSRELYGLDEDEAPTPTVRRPGMKPALAPGNDWSRQPRDQGVFWGAVVGGLALLLAVVGVCALLVVGPRRQPPVAAPIAQPLDIVRPNFGPIVPPPIVMPPPRPPADPALAIHVTLTNGKSSPVYSPLGTTLPGVSIRADYHINGKRPPGITRYVTVVTGPRGRATSMFDLAGESGTVGGKVPAMSQADGPFEMYIEAETFNRQRHKVSESIPLPWDNTPPPQRNPAQPPRFGQPPGFPNNPANRGPGMPNVPRFGPRGRM